MRLFERFAGAVIRRVACRDPDFVIGAANPDGAYMQRWWLIPRNRVLNVYLHRVLRDDDDRALHDHPWVNCSIVLKGGYVEHTIAAGGINRRRWCPPGTVTFRLPGSAHRLELPPGSSPGAGRTNGKAPSWSLFITGPNVRTWGFHCPERGWVDWKTFTRPDAPGEIGPGCGD